MKTTFTSLKVILSIFAVVTVLFIQTELTNASDAPRVTSSTPTDLSELPRTGLPLAAWALGALAPIGLKFLKGKKEETIDSSPNSIWTNRQLKK